MASPNTVVNSVAFDDIVGSITTTTVWMRIDTPIGYTVIEYRGTYFRPPDWKPITRPIVRIVTHKALTKHLSLSWCGRGLTRPIGLTRFICLCGCVDVQSNHIPLNA
jgi:hypothetical protein